MYAISFLIAKHLQFYDNHLDFFFGFFLFIFIGFISYIFIFFLLTSDGERDDIVDAILKNNWRLTNSFVLFRYWLMLNCTVCVSIGISSFKQQQWEETSWRVSVSVQYWLGAHEMDTTESYAFGICRFVIIFFFSW